MHMVPLYLLIIAALVVLVVAMGIAERAGRRHRARILDVLADQQAVNKDYETVGELYGLTIAERAKVSRGVIYVHLSQLEAHDFVISYVDPLDKAGRRLYRITPEGQRYRARSRDGRLGQ